VTQTSFRTVVFCALTLVGCQRTLPVGTEGVIGPDASPADPTGGDGATPMDGSPSDDRTLSGPDLADGMMMTAIVCNLGQDPTPCTDPGGCGAYGATCPPTPGVGCVCIVQNCTPGQDFTCNDDPGIQSFHGHCTPFGSCMCNNGKNPVTGKCY
jgi:hypothetical protein